MGRYHCKFRETHDTGHWGEVDCSSWLRVSAEIWQWCPFNPLPAGMLHSPCKYRLHARRERVEETSEFLRPNSVTAYALPTKGPGRDGQVTLYTEIQLRRTRNWFDNFSSVQHGRSLCLGVGFGEWLSANLLCAWRRILWNLNNTWNQNVKRKII